MDRNFLGKTMQKKNVKLNSQIEKPTSEKMLSVGKVAERLGVSLSFGHKLVRNGEIESYRFGNCRRVSEEQFQTYVDSCLVEVQADIANRQLKHF